MPRATSHNGLVLIGGGGHALVVAEAAGAVGLLIAGFYDDDAEAVLASQLRYLGKIGEAITTGTASGSGGWLIAVGDVTFRAELIERLRAHEHDAMAVVHGSAIVSPSATIGRGAFVGPGAIVNAKAYIGEHAIVNSGAIIEHECEVGVNTHIAPGAVLGGCVRVGANTLVGIGATVLPGVVIGSGSVVGAGSTVIEDVADGDRVAGTPARPLD